MTMPSAAAPHSTASICNTVGVLTRLKATGRGGGTVLAAECVLGDLAAGSAGAILGCFLGNYQVNRVLFTDRDRGVTQHTLLQL